MHPPRVGPYLIDRKIGAGGMGTVYVGTHETSGQQAAIKVLPASLARQDGFILRFNREIDALKLLNHPNIVKFYESGTDDETYFYAMEYINGDTLTGRLRRDRKISWQETIQIAVQICAGLKHAHDVGVIHRDLKPSNLLIAADGAVKITDFGVAQVFAAEQLTITGAIIGTAEFMSPEQVEGRRADRRSDLYSLGTVLYTMLVGRPPFEGGSPAEIMQKQRFGRFDPPRSYDPEIPSWLDEIVCQLLEKNPEKRLPDAYVVSRRLLQVSRKVDLKNSIASPPNSGPDAETRLDNPIPEGGQLGATLVRDLMLAHSQRNEEATPFERMFNNTWVLVGMLIMVLAGLFWFWPKGDEDSGRAVSTPVPGNEPDRILQSARWKLRMGDDVGAKQQLEALRDVIANDDSRKATLRAIDKLLATIRNQRPTHKQAFIRDRLAAARSSMKSDPHESKRILAALLYIYEGDRSLSGPIAEVKTALKDLEKALIELPEPNSSPLPDSLEATIDPETPQQAVPAERPAESVDTSQSR